MQVEDVGPTMGLIFLLPVAVQGVYDDIIPVQGYGGNGERGQEAAEHWQESWIYNI